ncbi:MAG TPA: phosphatase PAP2 family protein [Gemmatimonadota bacterium]|nr:phosphatase PAP2 family protein [Gemmatimonadota bacterium]
MSRRPAGAPAGRATAAAAAALLLLGAGARPAPAREAPGRPDASGPVGERGSRAAFGPGDTASAAPSRSLFRTSDVPYAGLVLGAPLLVEPLEGFERGVRSHTPSDPAGFDRAFVDAGNVAGNVFVDLGLAAAAWGGGRLAGSARFERAGRDAVEALVAADAVAVGGKVLLGRGRPYATSDPDRFSPLAFHEADQSYPSGHATRVFALAAVAVGDFPDQRWLPWVAWPAATAVAASRVVGKSHWVTDVAAGAALGILSSRVVLRLNARTRPGRPRPERRAASLVLVPVAGGAGAALDLPLR